jgi:ATP-dependent Clp protease ATP-binding subunit ClpA
MQQRHRGEIAEVVSKWTGIGIQDAGRRKDKLLRMGGTGQRVVGQAEALNHATANRRW